MEHRPTIAGIVCAAALAASCGSTLAQSPLSSKLICHSIGYSPAEPLGDREGHAVFVGQFTCRTEGGPMDGGVLTGVQIWEYDKTSAVSMGGTGITRKPGATLVYQTTEAKLALTMTDGQPAGFTGSGRGVYKLATGAAAVLNGKPYSYTFPSTGPFEFVVDVKVD